MSSRFPIEAALAGLALLAGCDKGGTRQEQMPEYTAGPQGVPVSGLIPGGGERPTAPDPRSLPYLENAAAVTTGMRLYKQFNCSGCHFNGGGGIGPPLMDSAWIYGGRMEQIYDTIYHGRPNGMPAWGGKIPDQQIWQIAAYVRSMSLPETLRASGEVPSQQPAPVPREADMFDGWHVPKGAGGNSKQPL
jgi:cytochrome c oxidase cbb3-type subunit 3